MVAAITELDELLSEMEGDRHGVYRAMSLTFAEICSRPGVYVDTDVADDRLDGHRFRVLIGEGGFAVGMSKDAHGDWVIYELNLPECRESRYFATDATFAVTSPRRRW